MMKNEKIVEFAIKEGFADAAIIDTADIVFNASFRPYCEENLCGQYGANYSCPPDCGAPEEMRQWVQKHFAPARARYPRALLFLLKSIREVRDLTILTEALNLSE